MGHRQLSELSVGQLGEHMASLGLLKLKSILEENEVSGAMLSEVSSAEDLQSLDSSIKPLEAKGWLKEIENLKNKLANIKKLSFECPVCFGLYSEVDPTTLTCGHSVCIEDAQTLKKCPICNQPVSTGQNFAVNYSIRNLALEELQTLPHGASEKCDGKSTCNGACSEILRCSLANNEDSMAGKGAVKANDTKVVKTCSKLKKSKKPHGKAPKRETPTASSDQSFYEAIGNTAFLSSLGVDMTSLMATAAQAALTAPPQSRGGLYDRVEERLRQQKTVTMATTSLLMGEECEKIESERHLAIVHYKTAAQLKDPYGMFKLGFCHETGIGTPVDYHEAKRHYSLAVLAGSSDAMVALGRLHEHGRGVAQNWSRAEQLYAEAREKGHAPAVEAWEQLQKRKSATLGSVLKG